MLLNEKELNKSAHHEYRSHSTLRCQTRRMRNRWPQTVDTTARRQTKQRKPWRRVNWSCTEHTRYRAPGKWLANTPQPTSIHTYTPIHRHASTQTDRQRETSALITSRQDYGKTHIRVQSCTGGTVLDATSLCRCACTSRRYDQRQRLRHKQTHKHTHSATYTIYTATRTPQQRTSPCAPYTAAVMFYRSLVRTRLGSDARLRQHCAVIRELQRAANDAPAAGRQLLRLPALVARVYAAGA